MFLSLIELKHKRAFYVVLQGEVLQVTKCLNKQPSLWNMKSFDTLVTISWKMDSRDCFYGFSLLFNIFAEKKTYYAGIMLDAPSIVLCSKLCRHNVSHPSWHPSNTPFHCLANHSFRSIFENLVAPNLPNQRSFFIFPSHGGKVISSILYCWPKCLLEACNAENC